MPLTRVARRLAAAVAGIALTLADDLFMGAIQLYHSFDEIVVRAILAGKDLLVFSNDRAAAPEVEGFAPQHDLPERVIDVVRAAIERGELTESRIDASYPRLLGLRQRLLARSS